MTRQDATDQRDRGGSPERFGYSWAIWHEILPEHQEQFRRWTSALSRETWRGVRFLDVGCGMGRNSHWAMSEQAAGGVAIDIDDRSLAAARTNLASHPSIEIRHQSIYELSETDAFDVAFSIGVVHHLAQPEFAIQQMVRAVRPDGHVLIWVYGAENNTWLMRLFDPIRRHVLSRLPLGAVYHLSFYPSGLLWIGLRLGIAPNEYFRFLRRQSFRQVRVIVFDQMIPRIANYWPKETVESLMRQAGLEDICVKPVNDVSWSASGRKPAPTNDH